MSREYAGDTKVIKNSRGSVVNVSGELGNPTHRSAQVAVNSTAQAITITSGKRTIFLYNTGTKDMYFGASGVTNTIGGVIYAGTGFQFTNVKDNWVTYVVTKAGDTTTLQIVEC